MKLVLLVFFNVFGVRAFAEDVSTSFKCFPVIAQQSFARDHYNVEGEQNPPIIRYNTSEGPKTYFFKTVNTGNYIHRLAVTEKAAEAILKLDLSRAIPTDRPDLPKGVQIILDTKYAYTRAPLGMRDTYSTYVQNITAKLPDGKLGFIVMTCVRDGL